MPREKRTALPNTSGKDGINVDQVHRLQDLSWPLLLDVLCSHAASPSTSDRITLCQEH